MPFTCSICGEESTRICARCTKDACNNHLCEKCQKCSDCCECEVALSEPTYEPVRVVRVALMEEALDRAAAPPELPPDDPEPHLPEPDPDPEPSPFPDGPEPLPA